MIEHDQEVNTETGELAESEMCPCPEGYPDWDGKIINLGGWCVHEMKIASFFHMPMAYDMYVSKQAANVQHLGLVEKWPGFLMTKTGMWGGRIMRLLEDSESPSRLVHYLSEPFFVQVKLHNGGVGTVPKAVHEMQIEMVERGQIPKDLYLAHLTCPLCEERKHGDKIMILRKFTANERITLRLEDERRREEKKAAKKSLKESGNKNTQTSV